MVEFADLALNSSNDIPMKPNASLAFLSRKFDRPLPHHHPQAILALVALTAAALARPEPPVGGGRSYLPPQSSNGGYPGGRPSAPPSAQYGPPSDKYGPPKDATEDPYAEPASYKFEYKVKDEEAALDFGHQEEREGEEAKGEFRVLLPDGRTQVVTYTADESGYHPEIKYEEAQGGYPKGPSKGQQGPY
ncbi:pro-resilin-like [Hetaerina americana]|uniref:pro-resilin-like n=1 Tax=Hetaerina americana TaxID=62018 RepID=UPI003A7F546B